MTTDLGSRIWVHTEFYLRGTAVEALRKIAKNRNIAEDDLDSLIEDLLIERLSENPID